MDIYCPACQKKLQIADANAGQTVKCPSCAANFQAPSLPSAGPLPSIELLVPPAIQPTPAPILTGPPPSEPADKPAVKDEYARSCTINLRKHIVTLIPPAGMAALFVLSFFPWRHSAMTTLNLWELAFTEGGFAVFLFYVLLLFLAGPMVFLPPLLEKQLLPTPPQVRPYLPWVPVVSRLLNLAVWLLFLTHYFQCTIIDAWDPATLWMKLAFRIHALIVVAAFLDYWLERRKRWEMAEPKIQLWW